jgi:hypothetical protein
MRRSDQGGVRSDDDAGDPEDQDDLDVSRGAGALGVGMWDDDRQRILHEPPVVDAIGEVVEAEFTSSVP